MEHAAALNPRTPRVWGDRVLVMVIGVAGVLMAHSPMILSGFRRLQIDLGDSRLIHYLLEHGYLWIRGAPGHREFWNPPFFYPAPNAAAYTDLFLTVGPPYWIYRAAGILARPVVRALDGDDVGAQLRGRRGCSSARA